MQRDQSRDDLHKDLVDSLWLAQYFSWEGTADFRMVDQKTNGKWLDFIANGNTGQ